MDGKKILIVDDDPELIALVGAWLGQAGYEPVTASDAMSCMLVARKEIPAAILLDLGLPAGGGIVALERLKRNASTSSIPVIVLTARNTQTARAEADQAGASAFMPKEGKKEDLLNLLSEVLEGAEPADSF